MSGNNCRKGDAQNGADELSIPRRTVLQTLGAGVVGAGLVPLGAGQSTETCAVGPFEGTYSGATVTLSDLSGSQTRTKSSGQTPSTRPLHPTGGKTASTRGLNPSDSAQQLHGGSWWPDGELEIHTEYNGVNAEATRGGVPSDSQIATGLSEHVHALNQQIAVFDKDSGERIVQIPLEALWEEVLPEPDDGFVYGYPFVFDPRARYDRRRHRYVLAAVQYQPGITEDGEIIDRERLEEQAEDDEEESIGTLARPPKGYFVVAASATPDPTGRWHVYRVPPEDANGPDNRGLVDYPTLGLDRDAIYLTQNFFPGDASGVRVSMVALNKEQLYRGKPVTGHQFDDLGHPDSGSLDFTVQPAFQPYSGGRHGTYYLINNRFPTTEQTAPANQLTLWKLTDPLGDPSLRCFSVDVPAYTTPPAARQPGSDRRVDAVGRRLMNADFNPLTNSLWTAHATATDWNDDGTAVAAIRWYEIDVESNNVRQTGLFGSPDQSFFMPTIGTHGRSTMLVYNVSGPETYPRMDVAGRKRWSPENQLSDSATVQQGSSPYDYGGGETMRWGDYNGISVDPISRTFWTVSQYSPDVDIPPENDARDPYHTRIANVSFEH